MSSSLPDRPIVCTRPATAVPAVCSAYSGSPAAVRVTYLIDTMDGSRSGRPVRSKSSSGAVPTAKVVALISDRRVRLNVGVPLPL